MKAMIRFEFGNSRCHLTTLVCWTLAVLGLGTTARAQLPSPRIGYVYPAGGRQGATFQIAVGGQMIDGVTNVYITGKGIAATVVDFNKPMPQGTFTKLRDELKELQERKQAAAKTTKRGARPSTNTWTTADEKRATTIREMILKNPPNRNATPAIAEVATIKVSIAADAEPGEHEIRLGTPNGLSNPLVFHVGQLPEYSGPPAKADNPDLKRFKEARYGMTARKEPVQTDLRISLPATVNGQITPGAVDRFRFAARKGQRLVVAANARGLIPYLPDAVPGWFQATLALFDAKGNELAYDDDYRFNPDPVLFYEIPADGDYAVEIKDSIYRGREDFVYRITIGELPFITSIFPLGCKAGTQTTVELKGWNLPVTKLTPDTRTPGVLSLSVTKDERVSNRVPFIVDDLPETLEQEPNTADAAQNLTLPVIINGRIHQSGDVDVFRFEGRAGDEIVAEVSARRLNSPLDSTLRLTDAAGKQIAANDDHEDKGAGLTTHHADSYLRARLPGNGTYFLHLGDTQRKGGAEYAYRLRVSAPQPDFELRVVPSSISVRGGGTVPVTVYALRKDGFTNEINLTLQDAPAGFTLSGARVPPGQDQVRLTLTAPTTFSKEPVRVQIEGRARVQGHEVVQRAVPAEDMMQAFAYRHLVTSQELDVAVGSRWNQKHAIRLLGKTPVLIPAGGTARVQVGMPSVSALGKLHLELSDPPEGVSIKDVTASGYGTEIVLECDASKAKQGMQGNLIVNAYSSKADAKSKSNQRRVPVGTLPAIAFEIVSK